MTKSDEAKVNKLIHRIGLKHNLKDSQIKDIIESQFRFAFEEIKNLDTEKDIEDLKTTFIFKYLGKLYINKLTFNKQKNGRKEEF